MFKLVVLLSALLALTVALPNGGPSPCDVATTVDFNDLPNVVAGAPAAVNTVTNPYKGLDYGKGWGVTRSLSEPPTTKILIEVQTAPRGPTNIAADKPSGTLSYGLRYFDWSGQINSGQPEATVGFNTTLVMDGTTDKGAKVQATCQYVVPLAGVGVGQPVPPQRCTLPSTFAYVKEVLFSIKPVVGVDAAVRVVAISDMTYVLHKCPST